MTHLRKITAFGLVCALLAVPGIAFSQWMHHGGAAVSGGGGSTPAWNPADNVGYTLSAANTVATAIPSGATINGVRTTQVHTTGKWFFAGVATTIDTSSNNGFGVCLVSASLSANICGVQNSSGFVYDTTNSIAEINGAFVQCAGPVNINPGTAVNGDEIDVEIDLGAALAWIRIVHSGTPGIWNGSNCNGVPASGTGGFSIAAFAGASLAIVATDFNASPATVWTLTTSPVGTPDAGYTQF